MLRRDWIDYDLAKQLCTIIRGALNDKDVPSGRGAATLAVVLVNIVTNSDDDATKPERMKHILSFILDLYNNGFEVPGGHA